MALIPGGHLHIYPDWDAVRALAQQHTADADVSIVTSCRPEGLRAPDLVLSYTGGFMLAGAMYPQSFPWTANTYFERRLPPAAIARRGGEGTLECHTSDGAERPRAVSEYLLKRMILAGADRICFVISPGKSVRPHASGLCDALFRALCGSPAIERMNTWPRL